MSGTNQAPESKEHLTVNFGIHCLRPKIVVCLRLQAYFFESKWAHYLDYNL